MKHLIILLTLITISTNVFSQALTIDSAVKQALEKHPAIIAAETEVLRQSALKRGSIDIPKTEISLTRGQFNSVASDENFTIAQTIPFPVTMIRARKVASESVKAAHLGKDVSKNELAYTVKQTFNRLLYLKARREILQQQDSLYIELLRAANLQYKTGETTLLTKTLAETQQLEISNELERNENDIQSENNTLRLLCRTDFQETIGNLDGLIPDNESPDRPEHNPMQLYMDQQVKIAAQEKRLEVSRLLPELKVGYFNQTLIGTQNINGQDVYFGSSKRFDGFQFGLTVPLFFSGYSARVKGHSYQETVARTQAEAKNLEITEQFNQALQEVIKNKKSLTYYRESALKVADLLLKQTQTAFVNGEIDYQTMLLATKQALGIREGYLNALYQYNESLITIQYLKGKTEN